MLNICVVNYNSLHFIENLYKSILKTISKDRVFTLCICDNGSGAEEIENLKSFQSSNTNIRVIFRQQDDTKSISFSHADAINTMIMLLWKQSSHIMIVDHDCFFIEKNWDTEFDRLLRKGSFVCTTSKHRNTIAGPFIYYAQSNFTKSIRKNFYPQLNGKGILKSQKKDTGYLLSGLDGWIKLNHTKSRWPVFGVGSYDIFFPNNKILASHFGEGRIYESDRVRYNLWMENCRRLLSQ